MTGIAELDRLIVRQRDHFARLGQGVDRKTQAHDRNAASAWVVPHPGTDLVALLGGTTSPQWRGRGLHRALLAARARQAPARGFRLLHADASPARAPMLRRHGFRPITTSTHYPWTPPDA